VAASVAALIVSATPLAAQDISINFGQGTAGGGLLAVVRRHVGRSAATKPDDLSMRVLVPAVPAFMFSELKQAFEIGFLLFLPFLIIDLVVASVLTSMGMMMMPPVVVSLPFKLIFFVLVDGWTPAR
jgi:flagellar biosynthesis protein FliP